MNRAGLLVGVFFWASVNLIASTPLCCQTPTTDALRVYLAQPANERRSLETETFASAALTKAEATATLQMLWEDRKQQLRQERAAEMQAEQITLGDKVLKFTLKEFGDRPATGHSLVISMHGGGNAPPRVNEQQWKNQQKLYELEEGFYVAPRAPTDTWNLWHEGHIDPLFDRLIENMIALHDVDPNRIYLTGYSAGGDGVYQLAPRMADRFAAAAMMAGHPNEASPLGLRNLPFAIHVGENDDGYGRNKVARDWEAKLKELHTADPNGYEYYVKLHAGRGHWMNREDAEAIGWMAKHTRQCWPHKVVWRQDDVVGTRFYWLATPRESAKPGQEVVAQLDGQTIKITAPGESIVGLRLSDQLLDLDKPIHIQWNDLPVRIVNAERTIAVQYRSLLERADPESCATAEISLP